MPGIQLPQHTRVVLVAGIANPERFAEDVRAAGWDVAGESWFPDHHSFTQGDIQRIAGRALELGAAAVFTTEKDAVRFESLGPTPFALFAVPLVVEFDPPTVLFDRIALTLRTHAASGIDGTSTAVHGTSTAPMAGVPPHGGRG